MGTTCSCNDEADTRGEIKVDSVCKLVNQYLVKEK